MNEGIQFAKLATRLLSDLSESETNSTDDQPLELKQLQIVLEAFNDVADVVERRVHDEYKRQRPNQSPAADDEGLGEIG